MRLLPLLLVAACAPAADAPALEVSPAALDLGVVPVGQAATASLTIMNQGPGIAHIDMIAISETASGEWSLLRADTTDLFAGATSDVEVEFAPRLARASQSRLVIRSNDPATPVLGVPLAGIGAASDEDTGDTGDTSDTGDTGGEGGVGDPAVDDDGDGRSEVDGDCDDGDSAVFPGAAETCDGADEDCSGVADDVDLDGDGHSPCDAGGDCDDLDPAAFPVVVEAGAVATPDGTVAAPFSTLEAALENLDATCRTAVLLPGLHSPSLAWNTGSVTVRGAGAATEVVVTPPAGARAFSVGESGTLALHGLTLQGARGAEGDGGALYVEGQADLTAVRLLDNRSAEDGGAIAVRGGSVTLDGCVLYGNEAAEDGGALFAWDATITDAGSTWSGNAAQVGGALAAQQSRLTTVDGTWIDNTADRNGGALALRGGEHLAEGGVYSDNAAGESGGALFLDDDSGGTLRNLLVLANRAESGGGIAVTGSPDGLVIANNTLVGNEAEADGGGLDISTGWYTTLDVVSNIVVGSGGWSGVHARGDSDGTSGDDGIAVVYTLAYGSAGDDFDLDWGSDQGHNDVDDPLFTRWSDDGDASNDVFTLPHTSPAVDSGPEDGEGPDGYTDWADPDGSRNDRGHTGGPGAG